MAALAVQVPPEDWGDGGIVNWLKDEMTSHPEYIPGFLELLTVLPEVHQLQFCIFEFTLFSYPCFRDA